jgi:hypothetical protein
MAETADPSEFTLIVGGATFVLVPLDNPTLEHDGYLSAQLERAGLGDPTLAALSPAAREHEMILRIFESGEGLSRLLAGFLVERGKAWSKDRAILNAKRLNATAATERAQLLGIVRGVVAGFFSTADSWPDRTDSPSASAGEPADPSEPTDSEASTAARGRDWSDGSGDTTPTPSAAAFSGPSAMPSAPTSST